MCIYMHLIGGYGLSYSLVPSHSDEDLSRTQRRYTSGDLGACKAFTPEARRVHKQQKSSPPLPLSLEQQVTSQKTSPPLARDGEAEEKEMERTHSRQPDQFEERDDTSTPRLEEDQVPTPKISENNRTEEEEMEGEEKKERFDFQPNESTSTLIEETVSSTNKIPMPSAILTHHRHTSACRCPFDKHCSQVLNLRVTHASE